MSQQPLAVDNIRPHLTDPMRSEYRTAIYATLHLLDNFDQALCDTCTANILFCQNLNLQNLSKREVAFREGQNFEQLATTAPCGVNPNALICELAKRLQWMEASRQAAKMPFISEI